MFLLLALLLCATVACADTLTYESDFSRGTDGWYGRGAAVFNTKEGLFVGGRTATWNSPGRPFKLTAGSTYEISVEVKQTVLDSGRFILSCEHARNGETTYENLASANVPKNEWTTISTTWVPGDYDTYVLYVEGGEANTNFTIRNFTLYGGAPVPKAEAERKPFVAPDTAEGLTAYFDALTLNESYKKAGNGNPLFTQRFGADPGYLVWNDRLYIYTTNDVIEYNADGSVRENSYGQVDKINCISSDDLVNWTDHGAIPVAGRKGIATWASNSWAPCAAHKVVDGQDKFFLYFCNGGNGVSVLTADNPAGPWTDPLGHGLITRSVPNCANVPWLFDPAVFVDKDGTGYLYFGGGVPDGMTANPGTIRCVQLGDDMLSLVGEPQAIDAPYVFEDSSINRIGDTYYYSYCSNWNTGGNKLGLESGAIQYMTSANPLGPYTYIGQVFANQGRFFGLYGNNHHSILCFRGEYYLAYHNRPVEQAMGITGNYRSPQLDRLTVNADGSLAPVTGTMKGIAQLQSLNPYARVSAQTMSRQAGLEVTGYADTTLTVATTGDWLQVSGADFASGASAFTLMAGSETGGAVRVTSGSEKGETLCEFLIPAGTAMTTFTVDCADLRGLQDVYLVFAGDVSCSWWQFTQAQ
ncbi:MAG: family 43 glycosylhydrolase, partial [Clostridia bacterium]|nr:family 43 glycosylhydrolase [Clostridia bacterium]